MTLSSATSSNANQLYTLITVHNSLHLRLQFFEDIYFAKIIPMPQIIKQHFPPKSIIIYKNHAPSNNTLIIAPRTYY